MRNEDLFTKIYNTFVEKTEDVSKAIDMLYLYKELRLQIEDKPYSDELIKNLYDCYEYITHYDFSYCIDDFIEFLENKCVWVKEQKLEELDLEEIKKEFTE